MDTDVYFHTTKQSFDGARNVHQKAVALMNKSFFFSSHPHITVFLIRARLRFDECRARRLRLMLQCPRRPTVKGRTKGVAPLTVHRHQSVISAGARLGFDKRV